MPNFCGLMPKFVPKLWFPKGVFSEPNSSILPPPRACGSTLPEGGWRSIEGGAIDTSVSEAVPTKKGQAPLLVLFLMPERGFEPPRPCGHMNLNHARLPIPPLRLETQIIVIFVRLAILKSPLRGEALARKIGTRGQEKSGIRWFGCHSADKIDLLFRWRQRTLPTFPVLLSSLLSWVRRHAATSNRTRSFISDCTRSTSNGGLLRA